MRDLDDILEKNKGPKSIVKFVKTIDNDWYFIGYGGMGTTMFLKIEEELYSILNDKLEKEEMTKINSDYYFEIDKKGTSYYHSPKNQ